LPCYKSVQQKLPSRAYIGDRIVLSRRKRSREDGIYADLDPNT